MFFWSHRRSFFPLSSPSAHSEMSCVSFSLTLPTPKTNENQVFAVFPLSSPSAHSEMLLFFGGGGQNETSLSELKKINIKQELASLVKKNFFEFSLFHVILNLFQFLKLKTQLKTRLIPNFFIAFLAISGHFNTFIFSYEISPPPLPKKIRFQRSLSEPKANSEERQPLMLDSILPFISSRVSFQIRKSN